MEKFLRIYIASYVLHAEGSRVQLPSALGESTPKIIGAIAIYRGTGELLCFLFLKFTSRLEQTIPPPLPKNAPVHGYIGLYLRPHRDTTEA